MKKLTLLALCVFLTYSCTNTEEENGSLNAPIIAIDVVETVFLPKNSVEINATISDTGNQTQTILWKKTAGGAADFESDKKDITITNLVEGNYSFTLTVSNNNNQSSKESISFSVSDAKVLYNLDFENSNEGFTTSIFGNYTAGKELRNVTEETNHCGTVYMGKKEDFTDWLTYSYEGNNSNFVATNMGTCLGYFTSAIQKEITFTEDFSNGKLGIQFQYYKPGDFSKWGDYNLEILIFENDLNYTSEPIMTFTPTANPKGWSLYNENISLAKGTYKLVIRNTNAQTAIDNITFYKNN
ncbi:hypothetical protein [Polaribacter sp. Q13]|uniref:PKD domain-containing protein n=1 Tax=Polaribacter sp. Q13 TaxID=2806551 RepID=UPI00193BF351|nr:hypothetical protein [Polaribacter sp. Q13]QVY67223.1 hypothetical protein JOP69_08125 [Polaribacter sp. Q13]